MDLREYLFRKRISVTEFARQIDFARAYLNQVVSKRRIPGKKMAEIIEHATNGEVTLKDLSTLEKDS